jgi:glycosyltransferase involved in cell wall biosynthesis
VAAGLHPELLGFGDRSSPWVLEPRNWARPAALRGRRCILMPQNAWPWAGDVAGLRPRARRCGLRLASEASLRLAAGVVRIGSSIPRVRATLGEVLPNVLDEGFEVELARSYEPASDPGFTTEMVSVGSMTTYRGIERLLAGMALYRQGGGGRSLTIAGPGTPPERARPPGGVAITPGRLERAQVIAAFRQAPIVIFPSTVEVSSPISVLEALEVASCVVLSDIPGHRDLPPGHAPGRLHYYDPEQPSSLARLLLALDGEVPEASAAPRPRAEEAAAARARARQAWCEGLVGRLVELTDPGSRS